MGFWSSAYDGAATIGKIDSWITLFVYGLLAFFAFVVGGLLVAGVNVPIENGQTIAPKKRRPIGFAFSGIALLLVFVAVVNWYLTKRYKPYAAFSGTSAAISGISSLFD